MPPRQPPRPAPRPSKAPSRGAAKGGAARGGAKGAAKGAQAKGGAKTGGARKAAPARQAPRQPAGKGASAEQARQQRLLLDQQRRQREARWWAINQHALKDLHSRQHHAAGGEAIGTVLNGDRRMRWRTSHAVGAITLLILAAFFGSMALGAQSVGIAVLAFLCLAGCIAFVTVERSARHFPRPVPAPPLIGQHRLEDLIVEDDPPRPAPAAKRAPATMDALDDLFEAEQRPAPVVARVESEIPAAEVAPTAVMPVAEPEAPVSAESDDAFTDLIPVEAEVLDEAPVDLVPVERPEPPVESDDDFTDLVPVEAEVLDEAPVDLVPVEAPEPPVESDDAFTDLIPVEAEVLDDAPVDLVPVERPEPPVASDDAFTDLIPVEAEVLDEAPVDLVPVEAPEPPMAVAAAEAPPTVEAPADLPTGPPGEPPAGPPPPAASKGVRFSMPTERIGGTPVDAPERHEPPAKGPIAEAATKLVAPPRQRDPLEGRGVEGRSLAADLTGLLLTEQRLDATDVTDTAATLVVADLQRSVEFYTDTLGLHIVDRTDEAAVLEAGFGKILLWERPDAPPGETGVMHLTFEVGDIEATFAEMNEAGVEFLHLPRTALLGQHYEMRAASFRDPDGHGLAITEHKERD